MIEGQAAGFSADPNQTLTDYLTTWVTGKQLVLKPTTYVRYRDYVTRDLIPALGTIRLDDLGHSHIAAFTHTQLAARRGKVTVHRCLATLSSALGDAVRHHRLPYNPARPTVIPRPAAAERQIWTVQDAIRFLHSCRATDPAFADLIEILIGTGIRKGEALTLYWDDVHLPERVLYIRYTLSAIDNNTRPKAAVSHGPLPDAADRVPHSSRVGRRPAAASRDSRRCSRSAHRRTRSGSSGVPWPTCSVVGLRASISRRLARFCRGSS
ncbi:integrase-like protein [Kitasatospora atroaurantiaca]|uniref:Integrase-like protein n=1 Tax=Kitasatospora atroaurantiaca TaxID=285545 RepID=A0A561EXF1_9ACTN|nr:integrase-like protein [Kitasatospora atroaurantiaca]